MTFTISGASHPGSIHFSKLCETFEDRLKMKRETSASGMDTHAALIVTN